MPRAYIRRGLVVVSAAGSQAAAQVAPEAVGAVQAFRECGWEVVVVGGSGELGAAGLDAEWTRSVEQRDPGAWLLTDRVADDRWARSLGLHTALVGPSAEQQAGPARCDVAFRDLRSAALEIIATDVPVPTGVRARGA